MLIFLTKKRKNPFFLLANGIFWTFFGTFEMGGIPPWPSLLRRESEGECAPVISVGLKIKMTQFGAVFRSILF
jgi:hypothetical protein